MINRNAVNPWNWSTYLGYNQGVTIEKSARTLICSGQTSVDENGKPIHVGKMREQMICALDNLETVIRHAEMQLEDLVSVRVFTTNMQETMQNFDLVSSKLGDRAEKPAMTLVGVTSFVLPELLFEIEATACA